MEVSNATNGYDTEPYIAPKEESKLRDSDSFATNIYLLSPEEQVRLLCQSAKAGKLKLLERYLELGLKDDSPNSNLPLYTAFLHNMLTSADLLIRYGANVDKKHNGLTLLFLATASKADDLVDYLLTKGANPNLTSEGNISATTLGEPYPVTLKDATPLHAAARLGNVSVMQSLIENKARISPIALKYSLRHRVWNNRTPLDLALRAYKHDAMELLFRNGAKISLSCYFFSSIFDPRSIKIIHKDYSKG